ncbi:MAG: hypothetical protein IKS34_01595 [Clostridia bacterium]|nr:hypothetical protein [Clostridia bacterium]
MRGKMKAENRTAFAPNSRTYAVWGAPKSGKTTFACRLANAFSCMPDPATGETMSAVVVCADNDTPVLPTLFPHRMKGEGKEGEQLPSLGELLSMPDMTEEDLLEHLVTGKENDRLGYLGYAQYEHPLSYPSPSFRTLSRFSDLLLSVADVIVYDLPSSLSDPLSQYAVRHCGKVFRLLSPDIPSAVWETSKKEMYAHEPDDGNALRMEDQIPCAGSPDRNSDRLLSDFRQSVTSLKFALPYRPEWKAAFEEGSLAFLKPGKKEIDYLLKAAGTKI